MAETWTDDLQLKLNQRITEETNKIEASYHLFLKNNGIMTHEKTTHFEQFAIGQLALQRISLDHLRIRITNEVKQILNEFTERVMTDDEDSDT